MTVQSGTTQGCGAGNRQVAREHPEFLRQKNTRTLQRRQHFFIPDGQDYVSTTPAYVL